MGGGGSKSKKKQRVNSHDKAVLDLKVQRDKLKQYQKQCDTVMKRETCGA
jgi:charged multivesicular body protein 6